MNTERHDPRFRNGLLGIAATLSGSVVVAWGLAALMLEAVTFPDMAGVALVSALSGVAFVPLGASLRLLSPPRFVLATIPIDRTTWLGGAYRVAVESQARSDFFPAVLSRPRASSATRFRVRLARTPVKQGNSWENAFVDYVEQFRFLPRCGTCTTHPRESA